MRIFDICENANIWKISRERVLSPLSKHQNILSLFLFRINALQMSYRLLTFDILVTRNNVKCMAQTANEDTYVYTWLTMIIFKMTRIIFTMNFSCLWKQMRKKELYKGDKESDSSKCPTSNTPLYVYIFLTRFSTFFDKAKPCILHGRNVTFLFHTRVTSFPLEDEYNKRILRTN